MIKIIFFIFMFFYIIFYFNKYIFQRFFQNIIFFIFFNFLLTFPLNNLNIWVKIYYIIGVDLYSFILIILRVWILLLIIIIREKNFLNLNYLFYFYLINVLLIILIICFIIINLILFYLLFESRLLPIFIIILGWGYQIDRIQAGFYIILYTLLGSLPLLVIIFYIYWLENSLMINLIEIKFLNFIIYLMIIIAFLIKIPIYFIHLWLPKAHVEAPVVGSIILAGVILKLGRYGLYRFIIIIINLCIIFNKFLIIISLIGGIYSGLICINQVDIKILVAYSSIVHIRILIAGLLTLINWGLKGGLNIIIAHGLCSSALFFIVNINYIRLKSRSLFINKGLINLFPSLRFMWFLLCSSNLSFPPSLNLFREIFLLNSLISWRIYLIIILVILLFVRALYSLYLYSYRQHGVFYKSIIEIRSIIILEYIILIIHWLPLNLIFCVIYIYI